MQNLNYNLVWLSIPLRKYVGVTIRSWFVCFQIELPTFYNLIHSALDSTIQQPPLTHINLGSEGTRATHDLLTHYQNNILNLRWIFGFIYKSDNWWLTIFKLMYKHGERMGCWLYKQREESGKYYFYERSFFWEWGMNQIPPLAVPRNLLFLYIFKYFI